METSDKKIPQNKGGKSGAAGIEKDKEVRALFPK